MKPVKTKVYSKSVSAHNSVETSGLDGRVYMQVWVPVAVRVSDPGLRKSDFGIVNESS